MCPAFLTWIHIAQDNTSSGSISSEEPTTLKTRTAFKGSVCVSLRQVYLS